jgi:hypothetical protein
VTWAENCCVWPVARTVVTGETEIVMLLVVLLGEMLEGIWPQLKARTASASTKRTSHAPLLILAKKFPPHTKDRHELEGVNT